MMTRSPDQAGGSEPQRILAAFKELVKKMKAYEEALSLMHWDLRTGAPRGGMEGRAEVIGLFSAELFKLSISDQMGEYVARLREPELQRSLDPLSARLVEECGRDYDRSRSIPPERYQAYATLAAQSEAAWEDAKAKADFPAFRPYLEKIVAFKLEFAEYWGYGDGVRYDALLDQYEPGMTVSRLDPLFAGMKQHLVPLVAAVADASRGNPGLPSLQGPFSRERQKAFSHYMLQQLGFDDQKGRLDESVHPFATGINPGDVRITTHYDENDLLSALFGTIHEFGHALYEQNFAPELAGTILAGGASMGIHESQSRFWENMIGRSRPFWNRYLDNLRSYFPGQLESIGREDFYRAVNRVEPSLIRIEADELTYDLHIMIRYELEKALIQEELQVKDLPEAWRDKYKAYLGVEPAHDGEGVLQDVHWSGGDFGYFPSYSIGNLYAAQMRNALLRDIPDLDGLVEQGEFGPVKAWMVERVHRHGRLLKPEEIIMAATGEPLKPDYFIAYLRDKYTELYGIKGV